MSLELLRHERLGTAKEIKFLVRTVLSCDKPKPLEIAKRECLKHSTEYGFSFSGMIELLKFLSLLTVDQQDLAQLKCQDMNLKNHLKDDFEFCNVFINRVIHRLSEEQLLSELFSPDAIGYDSYIRAIIIKDSHIPLKYSVLKKLLINFGLVGYHDNTPNVLVVNSAFRDLFEAKVMKPTRSIIDAVGYGMSGKRLILFIHGLGGSIKTWKMFGEVIAADMTLSDQYDLDYYVYPTSLVTWRFWRPIPKIQDLADGLKSYIDNKSREYDSIVLVCHSLGGLVGRYYILKEIKNRAIIKATKMILYATPNNGASLAHVGRLLSWRHYQIKQLCKDSDIIEFLNTDWETFNVKQQIRMKYVIAGLDNIVMKTSAQGHWGNTDTETVIDRGHFNIVLPSDKEDLSYKILKNFLVQ